MSSGKRWSLSDHWGHTIYLTHERWAHIVSPENHPELAAHEADLKESIQRGARKQDSLNPRKYRYSRPFSNLPLDNTHIVVIVLFGFQELPDGTLEPNNYITTAYMKEFR
jgi:hypothetical protein